MKQIFTVCISIFLYSLSITAAQAQQTVVVGHIEQLEGPTDAFEFYRNGQPENIFYMKPLHSNDELRINREQCKEEDVCRIILRFGSQKVLIDFSYYRVEAREPQSLPEKLMEQLGKKLNMYHKDHRLILSIRNSSNTVDLTMPLLSGSSNRIAAGKRPLHLGWYGGEEPYQVRIFHEQSNQMLLNVESLKTPYLQHEPVILEEGSYRVEIRDKAGTLPARYFQVVSEDMLPVPPADLTESSIDESAKQTLYALWLIEEHAGWNFEAYQLVAPLSDDYYPALLVRESLEFD